MQKTEFIFDWLLSPFLDDLSRGKNEGRKIINTWSNYSKTLESSLTVS